MSAQAPEVSERARTLPVVRAIASYFVARAPLKDSPLTTEAYKRDLQSVLAQIARSLAVDPETVKVADLTLSIMRGAFGVWAGDRGAGTIRRAHSTWSGFLDYLVGEELLPGSFMAHVAKPKPRRAQPKPFQEEAAARIVVTLRDGAVDRRDPWPELDAASVLTLMVSGTRLAELLGVNIGDVTRTPGSERMRVLGKGNAERSVPLEPAILIFIEAYLRTRRARFPDRARKHVRAENPTEWDWWRATDPLFVDRTTGERLQRGALKYLVLLVYRSAGVDAERARGALVHALRHTAATRMIERGATAVELMDFLGHRSLSTSQRYVSATAENTRASAARNPVYELLTDAGGPA